MAPTEGPSEGPPSAAGAREADGAKTPPSPSERTPSAAGPGADDRTTTDSSNDSDPAGSEDAANAPSQSEAVPHRGTPGATPDASADAPGAPRSGDADDSTDAPHSTDAASSHPPPTSSDSAPPPEEPLPLVYADPAPPELRAVYMGSTLYTRTGFHARLHLGASYLHIFNSSATNLGDQPDFNVENASVTAGPVDFELWLGGALRRDLALNFVLRAGQASSGTLHSDLRDLTLEGGLRTAFLGAGLLYYLDPARGWWLGLAAGFERWQASFVRGAAPQVGGSGVAVSLYGAHDWWLGDSTAFGGFVRLNLGFATGNGQAEVGELQLENSDIDFYVQAGVGASLSYF